ncbi:MAG: hypothetical protein WAK93_13690 [Solirubrobacteraceae bacterium]
MILLADLTATATLILAGITLALVVGAVALVVVTRQGTTQAREDAKAQLKILERQLGAGYRPLLVDVLTTAPAPPDMGAEMNVQARSGGQDVVYPGPTVETKLPGIEPVRFDPRTAFVLFQVGRVYLSVPLRNVGRGLAAVDGGGVELAGATVGEVEYRTIEREHVPVGETTRIDLITGYLSQQASDPAEQGQTMRGTAWQLRVPYGDFAGEQRAVVRLQIVCRGDDVNGPWLVERADQESPRDQEATRPDAGPTEVSPAPRNRRGVMGEPVTDLWGNPPRPRRRNR